MYSIQMYSIQWNHSNSNNYSPGMFQKFETYQDAKNFYQRCVPGFKTNQDVIVDEEEMTFYEV